MESTNTPETAPGTAIEKPETKDGAILFTVVMMLLAVACVGITIAIAFYDMAQGG